MQFWFNFGFPNQCLSIKIVKLACADFAHVLYIHVLEEQLNPNSCYQNTDCRIHGYNIPLAL